MNFELQTSNFERGNCAVSIPSRRAAITGAALVVILMYALACSGSTRSSASSGRSRTRDGSSRSSTAWAPCAAPSSRRRGPGRSRTRRTPAAILYSYLKYAREMRSFYQAHVREPVFLATTRMFLAFTGDQDVGVSFASLSFSVLCVLATYLLGSALGGRWVGLLAALALAVEYEMVTWAPDGWRRRCVHVHGDDDRVGDAASGRSRGFRARGDARSRRRIRVSHADHGRVFGSARRSSGSSPRRAAQGGGRA